jgi:Large polyvalent protein associated domain 29
MSITPKAKATATNLRKQLKTRYPETRFSIKTTQSGWMTVLSIEWTDGPTLSAVNSVVKPLTENSFNSIDDSWSKIPGVNTGISMVKTDRSIGQKSKEAAIGFFAAVFDGWRFTHRQEFQDAIDHLYGNPKSWEELSDNEIALAGLTRWLFNESTLIPGLVEMFGNCVDF